jgi:CheY-like chemotaxis protein
VTKVLIFETDDEFAGELRHELGKLGCTVQVFKDGNTGLMSASSTPPDVILVSAELPRVNGFSVCNKIKKHPTLRMVPLLILSQSSSPETFDQHRKLPTRAEDYVHKPVSVEELVARIMQFHPLVDEQPDAGEGEPVVEEVSASEVELQTLQTRDPVIQRAIADVDGGRRPTLEMAGIHEETVTQRRPTVLGLGPLAQQAAQMQAQGPAYELPSLLSGEDEDEETRVGARPPPSSRRPSGRPVRSESDEAARAALVSAAREVERARAAAAEAERLREELRRRDAASTEHDRETLTLREQLNARDRELVELRERLATREREIIDGREGAIAADRALSQLKKQLDDTDRARQEAEQLVVALEADKALSEKRAADFKAGAKKIAEQLNQRARELRDLATQHEAEVERLQKEREQALAQALEQHHAALRAAENDHRAEIERLRRERDEQVKRQETELAAVRGEIARERAELVASVRKKQSERDDEQLRQVEQLEAELQRLRDALADAEKARELIAGHGQRERDEAAARQQAEFAAITARHDGALQAAAADAEQKAKAAEERVQAIRHRAHEELAEAIEQHEAQLEELRSQLAAEGDAQLQSRLEAARQEHEAALADLGRENAEALQKMGYDLQEKLLEKEASFQETQDQLGRDLAAARSEAEELRQRMAELEQVAHDRDEGVERLGEERDQLADQVTKLSAEVERTGAELRRERKRLAEARQALASAAAFLADEEPEGG